MNQDQFRSMIVQLATKIENEELQMLKVALHDIINKAAELQRADALLLFGLLQSGGNISHTDVSLLYELFDVTGLQNLHETILHYDPKCPKTNKDISDYRRMLIQLGKSLEEQDVAPVAKLFDIMRRDSKDEWALINNLTRQMKLNDDKETMKTFANILSDQPTLKHLHCIVQKFVEQKKYMDRVNMEDGYNVE